jgi:hypothetical protein
LGCDQKPFLWEGKEGKGTTKGLGFFGDLGWWGKKMRDDDEQKGLLWRLPKLETADLGKLGPGFGYGIGCGFGVGAGVIGGLFVFLFLVHHSPHLQVLGFLLH